MPKSKTHTRVNLLILILFLPLLYLYLKIKVELIIVGMIVYTYSTLFFNPDTDLANQVKFFSLKGLLTLPMRICYAPFFKHRGLSHSLWGTITRIFSLSLFLIIIRFSLLVFISFLKWKGVTFNDIKGIAHGEVKHYGLEFSYLVNVIIPSYWEYFLVSVTSLLLSDFFHITLDKITKRR